MPELPDVVVYVESLDRMCAGEVLEDIRISGPSLLRSVDPPIAEARGKKLLSFRRLGKRIVFVLEDDLFLVLHLMIAGRLRWKKPGTKLSRKMGLAAFDTAKGSVVLTEASTKKRANLHLVRGEEAVAMHDPGGLEVLECDLAAFTERITSRNHTLKRALTDPTLLSGIGNAYSDEILHRARMSPIKLTQKLSDEELERLYHGIRETLVDWTERLRADVGDGFPDKVTAFREGMAVHGRHKEPCPDCGSLVQRIAHADNETNYCAKCQTGGRLLADRALSRLLKKDWPRSLEELETRMTREH
ncbi:MAG: formamidopyrimidine-DNA glycosylase [Myxococcales bacterium]|nr:formamidopyrimidine-DNA glycosylase [Myxococcales bacterium]